MSALNAWPNEAVSVRKKLFSEHHGRFSPGRCPQPQRQPQHLQRDDLPGEHIARDHRSHPFRLSFLEQKVFSVLKKICFPGEDCGDSGSELGGPGCHHHILPRSAHGKQLGNAHGEEETVIVSPFVDTGIWL